MIRSLALAAAAALALSFAAPGAARAQDAAAAPAPSQSFVGLTPDSVRAWLVSAGAEVGEVTRDGQDVFFRIDDGGLVWFVFFYGCEADGRCGDIQFNTVFSAEGVPADAINAWNRDKRFLKAFLTETDGAPIAFLQYDLLVVSGQPVEALADPTLLWLEGMAAFGQHLNAVAPLPTS